jgi:hypothetical protein
VLIVYLDADRTPIFPFFNLFGLIPLGLLRHDCRMGGAAFAIPIIGLQMLDGYRAYLSNPVAPPTLRQRLLILLLKLPGLSQGF